MVTLSKKKRNSRRVQMTKKTKMKKTTNKVNPRRARSPKRRKNDCFSSYPVG